MAVTDSSRAALGQTHADGERRPAFRTIEGWARGILLEGDAIRECDVDVVAGRAITELTRGGKCL
jgi:hypothetical protein